MARAGAGDADRHDTLERSTRAEELSLASLAALKDAPVPTELLVLGCGARAIFVPPALRAELKAAGLALEVVDTGSACRIYNVLLAEGPASRGSLDPAMMPIELYLAFIAATVDPDGDPGPERGADRRQQRGARHALRPADGRGDQLRGDRPSDADRRGRDRRPQFPGGELRLAALGRCRLPGLSRCFGLARAGRRSRADHGAGPLGAPDLRARLPGRADQSQDAAVLRRLLPAVHHAGPDRGRPAAAARRDVPRAWRSSATAAGRSSPAGCGRCWSRIRGCAIASPAACWWARASASPWRAARRP